MSNLHESYHIEQAKWDEQALRELDSLGLMGDRDFQQYAAHASTMRGIADFLGDLQGKRVLDMGCGLGHTSVLLAKSGAHVTAFDISRMSIVATRKRGAINGVREGLELLVAAGEALPFPDESFDVVFGKGVLHHLEPALGAPELYRVLKPGGKAAFSEPMGMNPVLKFARDHLPYPDKNPRGADRPLGYREIREWVRRFGQVRVEEFQLLSMLERGLGFNRPLPVLRRADDFLLKYLPFLRRYCRYVTLRMVKV
jgi:ubiquinone/menaquinone biosynthesis C-methylase UbiE